MTEAIDTSIAEMEIAAAERRVAAIRLRNAGASVAQVADKLGISRQQAQDDIATGLREILREPAENLIANQQAIVRDVIRAMYAGMAAGDPKVSAQVMKALEHQSKLFGLFAPVRVAVTLSDEDFAATAARLMREIGEGTPSPSGQAGPPVLEAAPASEDEWEIG